MKFKHTVREMKEEGIFHIEDDAGNEITIPFNSHPPKLRITFKYKEEWVEMPVFPLHLYKFFVLDAYEEKSSIKA